MMPVYEKVLEITVKQQRTKHLDENRILSCVQSGFREQHNCKAVITAICDKCDFKRAFETINRKLLDWIWWVLGIVR